MVATPLKVPGDLLIHVESLEYCTKTAIIRNSGVGAVTLQDFTGYPLKAGTNGADYNLAVAGDEGSVIALLVDAPANKVSETINATTNSPTKFQVVCNPPVIINQNSIRTLDVAGAAFNVASIVTALKALKWEFRSEPVKSTTL